MGEEKRGRGHPKIAEKTTTLWVHVSTGERLKKYMNEQEDRLVAEQRPVERKTANDGIKTLLDLQSICEEAWGKVSTKKIIEDLRITIEKGKRETEAKMKGLDQFSKEG